MEAAWFAVIGFMLVIYVVLDGFDFGAGILHLLIAKTDEERRTVLAAIGPFWDGNEVWLVAAGGVLVFAFPRVYSAAFSGFYLPLTMVLWLLILRGLSIELRSHQDNPLWRNFWDVSFALASAIIAAVLGASLGNLIRGVPLDRSGYFRAVLFTNFRTRPDPGVLDWYTILIGLFAVAVLAGHGAVYLWWKASGAVADRAERLAKGLWVGIVVALLPVTWATDFVQPTLFERFLGRPWSWPFLLLALSGAAAVFFSLGRRRDLDAFLGSSAFIFGMLGITAAEMFPTILPSTIDAAYSLTAWNAASGSHGLRIGFAWWVPAIVLAIAYFAYLFRLFRGKASVRSANGRY